jgi:hypothetical protein
MTGQQNTKGTRYLFLTPVQCCCPGGDCAQLSHAQGPRVREQGLCLHVVVHLVCEIHGEIRVCACKTEREIEREREREREKERERERERERESESERERARESEPEIERENQMRIAARVRFERVSALRV